jgi:hypothetical protein
MLESPEFEPEFYLQQNKAMENRYSNLFKRWGLKWNRYYEYASLKLLNNQYWIWVFLCGFEKFVQERGNIKEGRRTAIYKDADERIRRIIGDFYIIQDYLGTL